MKDRWMKISEHFKLSRNPINPSVMEGLFHPGAVMALEWSGPIPVPTKWDTTQVKGKDPVMQSLILKIRKAFSNYIRRRLHYVLNMIIVRQRAKHVGHQRC